MDGGYAGSYWMAYWISFESPEFQCVCLDKREDAECDCTWELLNKWYEEVRKPAIIKSALERHHNECANIEKGRRVKVVAGRKVRLGTEGVVIWKGEVNYDPYRRSYHSVVRVGIKDDEGNVYWTSACNCKVINPEEYYRDDEIIAEMTEKVDKEKERFCEQ